MQARTAAVLLVLVGLLGPAGAAVDDALHFGFPASVSGSLEATGVQWSLAMMDRPGTSTSVRQADGMSSREIMVYSVGEMRAGASAGPGHQWESEAAPQPVPREFALEPAGPSSLYVEGRLNVALGAVDAAIQIPAGRCLDVLVRPEDHDLTVRSETLCPASWPAVLVRMHDGSSMELDGSGVSHLQWHGMAASCAAEACPPGGSREDVSPSLPPPNYVRTRRYAFEDAAGGNATLHTTGPASVVLFGGTLMDLQVDGWLRLPLASGASACASCISPQNQTFFASGNLTLRGLSVDDDRRLQAHVDGEYANVRFDEAAVDPSLLKPVLTGAAVVATTATAAFLARSWLSALFTKLTEDEVLRNDRRRRLYEAVESHPGIHFREALRKAGLPSGAGRHHLTQLVRSGLVAERRIGANLRLFAGKSGTQDWATRVALRDERFKPILDWIAARPGASQKEVLDALKAELGWSLSTTQGRLARLVDNGVLHCVSEGRGRHYRLASPLASASDATSAGPAEAVQTGV